MLMELIKDNRKIVDRISRDQINFFVQLLKDNKVRLIFRISQSSRYTDSEEGEKTLNIFFQGKNLKKWPIWLSLKVYILMKQTEVCL